jgi:hypothetical protein
MVMQENVKETRVRSESCERAATKPSTIGYQPNDLIAEEFEKISCKEEHAQEKKYLERKLLASQQSQNIGFQPTEDESHNFEKFYQKGEQAIELEVEDKNSQNVSKQSKTFGFQPSGQKTSELSEVLPEFENLSPTKVINSAKEQAFRISREEGDFHNSEIITEFEKPMQKEHNAKPYRTASKSSERASLVSLPIGYEPTDLNIDELVIDKTKIESISPNSTKVTRGTASRTSKKLGYNPPTNTPEDFAESNIQMGNAKMGKIRSESIEQAITNPNKMGFEPLELTTKHLKDVDMKNSQATENRETKGKVKAQNVSITSGLFHQDHNVLDLKAAKEKVETINQKVERNKSSERATVHGKNMGFYPNVEESTKLDSEALKPDNADETKVSLDNRGQAIFMENLSGIFGQTEDAPNLLSNSLMPQSKADIGEAVLPKQRATSQIRVEGFEPILEDTKDYSTENISLEKSLKGEDKVHRESRSRALKRETKTGVSI